MVDLSVRYQRPDKSTAKLFAEVRLAFGDPRAENKGFVAGSGPTTWNQSSHNADAYGVAHAVDLGVDIEGDGTGIPVSAAEPLANFLRGFIGSRIAYVIYNHRIDAGNGWEPYYGVSPHEDHIHISTTWDYNWGDPAPAMAWNPDDGSVWGVAGSITPGGSQVRPIPETKDWFDMATKQDLIEAIPEALATKAGQTAIRTAIINELTSPRGRAALGQAVWGLVSDIKGITMWKRLSDAARKIVSAK